MIFYDGKRLLDKNCIYNFIVGGRASGKSYWLAKHLLKDYLEHGHKFVRVVRNMSYVTGLENYFRVVESDMKEAGELPDDYEGIYMKGFEYKIGNDVIGRVLSCSQEQKYKSLVFESAYVTLIYEEFVANDVSEYWCSPSFEIACFQSIISTVFRHRTGRVFFIGNNYEVNNPYFEHYGVNSAKLELGKITTFQNSFEVNGKKINGASVAVEYVPMAYENIEEIPVMLRTAENDMATTGEITKSPHILENCITFLRDDGGIGAILVTGIKLNRPKIFRTFWIRNNRYMSDEIYDNSNYREYIIIIDLAGVCLVSQIPDVEEALDLRSYGEAVIYQMSRTEGCYPMQQEMMSIPLDIETVTGTKINVMYFNNQATEYNFKQDCDDLKELRALNKRLGMGETPMTETVKDYVETCKQNNVHGYGDNRRNIYSDMTYQNYAANGLLEAKGFDVEGYVRSALEKHEAEEIYSLESMKENLAQIEYKESLKKKHGAKLRAKKREELETQFETNPDDVIEKVQYKIADEVIENIIYRYPDFNDNRISAMAESIRRKVNNVVRNKVTVNNVKDFWEILVNADYSLDMPELDNYAENAIRKLWKEKMHYEKHHRAEITNANEALPRPLPAGYSSNPEDYRRPVISHKPELTAFGRLTVKE